MLARSRLCLSLFALVFLGALAGCGSGTPSPPDLGGEDGKQIATVIDKMNDDTNTLPKLKGAFVKGATLTKTDVNRYQSFAYDVKGPPAVTGGTATATVLVKKHSSTEPVEKEWEFVKEGDKWKIKAAPLP